MVLITYDIYHRYIRTYTLASIVKEFVHSILDLISRAHFVKNIYEMISLKSLPKVRMTT